jgi:hypothetical protein
VRLFYRSKNGHLRHAIVAAARVCMQHTPLRTRQPL